MQAVKGTDKTMDASSVLDALAAGGFESADVTHNELARTHLQHLAGGRAEVMRAASLSSPSCFDRETEQESERVR